MDADLNDLIIKACSQFRLDVNLVKAIIEVESKGENFKVRYEPQISDTRLWHPREYAEKLNISYITECALQRMSWSYMQILGSTARWMGFELDLPMLNNPEIGMFYSCKYMRWIADRARDEMHLIAAWNGGLGVQKTLSGGYLNEGYIDKVYTVLRRLRNIE